MIGFIVPLLYRERQRIIQMWTPPQQQLGLGMESTPRDLEEWGNTYHFFNTKYCDHYDFFMCPLR